MRFKLDWASLIVGSKFTIFAHCFTLYLRAIFQVRAPGGLYLEGRFNGGFFVLPVWGAYTWRGLFSEFYGMKNTKEKSEYITVPKQFKINEFQNGIFLKPSSYYKYRDNLQHLVVNNNKTQSQNSRAVALSTHARLRFNSSMSSLLGAFDLFPSGGCATSQRTPLTIQLL